MILTTATPGRLLPTIRSRTVEVRFPLLSKAQVREILRHDALRRAMRSLAASLSGGSVTRALATLEGEEESLRAHVVRWFFESVEGKSPQDSWATRETLDDGLETIKMLVRDWIVAGGHRRHARSFRSIRPNAYAGSSRSTARVRRHAAWKARRRSTPRAHERQSRHWSASSCEWRLPVSSKRDVVVLLRERKGEIGRVRSL